MYHFPENLYTDVRIEDVFQTQITYNGKVLAEARVRSYQAAFIRVFDGMRWYYSSISDIGGIQDEIDSLARLACPDENIDLNPIVGKFEANRGSYLRFENNAVSGVPLEEKKKLLFPYMEIFSNPLVKTYRLLYMDERKVKRFYSSKGADLNFDRQSVGVRMDFTLGEEDKKLSESFKHSGTAYEKVLGGEKACRQYLEECIAYLRSSTSVEPGKYTVVLSPAVAGVFAHESFGHKSEADFMVGDEAMKKEWAIGSKVGSDLLNIVDDGNEPGLGFIPFDDEGTRAQKTYLIQNGLLSGRLHSAATAADLEESVTGNSRAVSFEYEPIVRMTCTYIEPGIESREQLIGSIKDGILVETFKHGSGMSTFTIAPNRSYRIRDGKIAEPVNISVITGSVFETLGEIDGVSDRLELPPLIGGGCGKNEQINLPVGFGGPYVRVRSMNIQ